MKLGPLPIDLKWSWTPRKCPGPPLKSSAKIGKVWTKSSKKTLKMSPYCQIKVEFVSVCVKLVHECQHDSYMFALAQKITPIDEETVELRSKEVFGGSCSAQLLAAITELYNLNRYSNWSKRLSIWCPMIVQQKSGATSLVGNHLSECGLRSWTWNVIELADRHSFCSHVWQKMIQRLKPAR